MYITNTKKNYISAVGLSKDIIHFNGIPVEQTDEYFMILINLIKCYIKQQENEAEEILVGRTYELDLIRKAIFLFKNKSLLMQEINVYPMCPDCNNCKVYEYCGTKNSVQILERVYRNFSRT